MTSHSKCPSCGAPHTHSLHEDPTVLRCAYCGTVVNLFGRTPSHTAGAALLTRADFNDPNLTGWEKINAKWVEIVTGADPCLIGDLPSSNRVHFLLRSSGYFEDQDIRLKVRFLKGRLEDVRAGFCARYRDGVGGYCLLISPKQTYVLGFYSVDEAGGLVWNTLVDLPFHSALKPGLDQVNEMRMTLKGTKITIYLNGVLVTSILNDAHPFGQTHLALEPGSHAGARTAFSDYIVYEA